MHNSHKNITVTRREVTGLGLGAARPWCGLHAAAAVEQTALACLRTTLVKSQSHIPS